jgi:ribosomal protein S18 acetylase RimI-like enzyme
VALAAEHDIHGVTVPEEAFERLPADLRSPDPGHWCLWTLDPASATAHESSAIDIALDDPRIGPLLAYSDSAHIFPGHPRLERWSGILDGDRLVAVAARITEPSGAAHLVSVCTDPQFRGRGLARDVCARLIDAAVAEGVPMIVLEMYVANDAGRRVYSRLGFTEVGRYRSGLLSHALQR